MSDLVVIEYEGTLVVDSRLVAQELGIEHESFMVTIKKYKTQTEEAFGQLRFQIGVAPVRGGNPPQYVFLTEEQATFLMTLSRNTPEVLLLKKELVQKFFQARELLRGRSTQPLYTTVYIQRLENMRDHEVADHLWTTFREGAEVLLLVEKEYRVPVSKMDLCDGSIGSHWKKYREGKSWAGLVESYTHNFGDQRGSREPNAYQLTELSHFRKWLREEYVPYHLPNYLVDKHGKRAVRQIFTELNQLNDYILEITEEKRPSKKQDEDYQIFLAAREAMDTRRFFGN
jgi:phage regulator Rha-like protein